MSFDASFLSYGALLVASGLGSGFAGGLFGIGGGVLRIPIFLHLFRAFGEDPSLAMHMAVGTSFALGIPTGLRSVASQVQFHLTGILYYRFKFFRGSPVALLVPGEWQDAVPGRFSRATAALARWEEAASANAARYSLAGSRSR